jgi:HemY protein
MKLLARYLILLLIATLIGIAIKQSSGYVLITYGNIAVETTLWFAIIFVLCGFLLLHGLLNCSKGIIRLPKALSELRKRRHNLKAQQIFMKGLQQLLEENWGKAEKILGYGLSDAATKSEENGEPIINCLAAAYAVNQQQNYSQRDYYLNIAQNLSHNDPKNQFTIAFYRLVLLVQKQQYEEALAWTCSMMQNHPKQKRLLQKMQKELETAAITSAPRPLTSTR